MALYAKIADAIIGVSAERASLTESECKAYK